MTQRPGYTATYDVIDKLDDYLPPDPAHRNAIIWRAVQAALDAEDAAGTEAVAELATELAEERTLVNQLRADLDHAERDNRRLTAVIKRIRELHRPESDQYHGKCVECAEWWPCPTIRDLEQ
ncbi:hypothetical protein ABZ249_30135 [Nocardiopsis sp. NPDC006139]|uniref:hypothetical protein n=1 Tax=Nocardiopsis sp. NPDC006139 TaxID=3154578 RepID=UPI0033B59708